MIFGCKDNNFSAFRYLILFQNFAEMLHKFLILKLIKNNCEKIWQFPQQLFSLRCKNINKIERVFVRD